MQIKIGPTLAITGAQGSGAELPIGRLLWSTDQIIFGGNRLIWS